MKKRLLSLLLVLTMVLGMIPVSVSAADVLPFTVTVDGQDMTQITESTLTLESAGSFAMLAVNSEGYVIEPFWVPYGQGATLREALTARY